MSGIKRTQVCFELRSRIDGIVRANVLRNDRYQLALSVSRKRRAQVLPFWEVDETSCDFDPAVRPISLTMRMWECDVDPERVLVAPKLVYLSIRCVGNRHAKDAAVMAGPQAFSLCSEAIDVSKLFGTKDLPLHELQKETIGLVLRPKEFSSLSPAYSKLAGIEIHASLCITRIEAAGWIPRSVHSRTKTKDAAGKMNAQSEELLAEHMALTLSCRDELVSMRKLMEELSSRYPSPMASEANDVEEVMDLSDLLSEP